MNFLKRFRQILSDRDRDRKIAKYFKVMVSLTGIKLRLKSLRPLIPGVAIADLIDPAGTILLEEGEGIDGQISFPELVYICHLVKKLAPHVIFEFGTFTGRTTINMAKNTGVPTQIYTLDIPHEQADTTILPVDVDDKKYIRTAWRGTYLANRDGGHIATLSGDSASFDFSPYEGKADFIFVDGSHSYEYVLNDSRAALRLLKDQGGMIVWHDYNCIYWEGVTKALDELYTTDASFKDLRYIEGTNMAFLSKKGRRPAGSNL